MQFKSNLYVEVITLPGFYAALVTFSTAVDISDDKDGMAMNILFIKLRVEATEQMTQNCMDIYFTIQESKRTQNLV